MDKSRTTKILIVILAAFILITVVSQIIVVQQDICRTEVARLYQMTDTIKFDGVFLRNEHTVSASVDGVLQYEHDDGAKVAKNSVIANVYKSGEDIELCRKIDTFTTRLETLKDAQNLAGTDSSQVEVFNNLITEKHSELTQAISSGDYEAVSALKYQLLNLQSKRDIAKGRTTGYENVISDIESRISSLKTGISGDPTAVISGETGYFVSSTDGYEDILSKDEASSVTAQQIKDVIASPVKSVTDNAVIGKMIEDYTWKLAAVVDTHSATLINVGSYVKLYYAADGSVINVLAESVTKQDDGSAVVIFSGDILTSSLAAARTGRFELMVDGYNGIRIPAQSVRFNEKGEKGVYILFGNMGYFRKIEELYSGEDFVIVKYLPGNEDGYLELYDDVIVSGKFDIYTSENSKEGSEAG